jgi:hypothetical protein
MSERFMRREVCSNRIPSYRFGRAVRIDPVDLNRYRLARSAAPVPAANDNHPPRNKSTRQHRAALARLDKLLA